MKKARCKECKNIYYRKVANQIFCCKECKSKYHNKQIVLGIKQRELDRTKSKTLKELDLKLKAEILNGAIVGYDELSDYLNIGKAEILKNITDKWAEFPKHIKNWNHQVRGKRRPTRTVVFYKEEIADFFKNNKLQHPKDLMLTLRNYKQPMTKVKNGFGYYGALMQTKNGEYVQCHICGKFFKHMAGHIYQTHKLKARDYKEEYGLSYSTALTSETMRWEYKRRTIKWIKSMGQDERNKYFEKRKRYLTENRHKRSTKQPKKQLEAYNKNGTCPAQLLKKIKDLSKKLERTPTLADFIKETGGQGHKHLIIKVFGSWKKALDLCGMKATISHGGKKLLYSDIELLEYLKIFAEENNEVPTHTDFKTGLLPSEGAYVRRFGSIEAARQEAGVYDALTEDKVKEFENKPKKITSIFNKMQFNWL